MSQATFVDPAVEFARLVAGARGLLSEASVLAGSGAVAGVGLAGLPELTAELFKVRDTAHALGVVAVDRLDASGVLVSAGFGSTKAFLTQRTGMAPGKASSVVSGARTLRSYAATRVALVAGRVTPDLAAALVRGQEAAIADKVAADRVQWRAFCEDYLLPIAEQGSVEEVVGAAAVLKEILDPEAAARRTEEAMAGQFLTVTQVGDQFVIKGALTLEDGAALKTLLDRMRDAKFRSGSLTPDEQPTGDAATDERRRRIAAAHQDALSLNHLVQLWLTNGMVGRAHGVRPHVTITTSVDDLDAGFPAEMTVPGVSSPVLVNAETVRRMLCDASVTEIGVTVGSVPDRHAHHHDGVPCHGPAHRGRPTGTSTASPAASSTPTPRGCCAAATTSGTRAAATAPSHPACAGHWTSATSTARSRAAGSRSGGARPTTSSSGSTAAKPTSTTMSCANTTPSAQAAPHTWRAGRARRRRASLESAT